MTTSADFQTQDTFIDETHRYPERILSIFIERLGDLKKTLDLTEDESRIAHEILSSASQCRFFSPTQSFQASKIILQGLIQSQENSNLVTTCGSPVTATCSPVTDSSTGEGKHMSEIDYITIDSNSVES